MSQRLPSNSAMTVSVRRLALLSPAALCALAGLGMATGCAPQAAGPRPLTADAFVARQGDGNNTHVVRSVDPEPPVIYNDVHLPLLPENQRPSGEEVTGISRITERGIQPPDRRMAESVDLTHSGTPTTRPATQPAYAYPGGQYLELGCVLAVVNGQPIYAHKVLSSIENALAAEARRSDPKTFRLAARKLITDQVSDYVRAELEFAAAQRTLSERERQVAELVTMQHRDRLVTEAGGALEVARRKAAEEGQNFDEQLQEIYRLYMSRLYYEKKVTPRIAVSAADMRKFYEANKETLYTQQGGIRFRLVQIDPNKYPGGNEQARDKAENVRRAAAAGADFGKLAAGQNDNKAWAKTEGRVGSADQGWWMQKGAFALEKVEAAVWDLRPGQVSAIIQDRGGFYVAKLQERRDGAVKPFVSEEVQTDIKARLRDEQFKALRLRNMAELMKGAIIREHPEMLDVAVDMAMQRYAQWAGQAASAQ